MPAPRLLLVALALALAGKAHAQLTVRSGSGADASALAATRDQFRTDLGGGTVAGANGSFGGIRREINWDGVPAAQAAPNYLPANFFNVNSPRGVVLSTPGTAFQVSGSTSDGQPLYFGNINFAYSTVFTSFSPQRLFTSLGGNVHDATFYVPGTTIPAGVSGFGAVFADVDQANTTAITFFDRNNVALGTFYAPVYSGGLSFLGAFTNNGMPQIARVRVTFGNVAIGPNDNNTSSDVVVADDFIFGEPTDRIFGDGFD